MTITTQQMQWMLSLKYVWMDLPILETETEFRNSNFIWNCNLPSVLILAGTNFGGWPKSEILLNLADHKKRQEKCHLKVLLALI